MDFDAAWQYLRRHTPLKLRTSGGTPFVVEVTDASIAYKSEHDQRRTQTKDNLERYFRTWFNEGRRESRFFTNLSGARSSSARFRYFSAVFRHLEAVGHAGVHAPTMEGACLALPEQSQRGSSGLRAAKPGQQIVEMAAEFSPCRTYRYALWRIWDRTRPYAMMILLNPSIADEWVDSHTSRRCIAFARDWGFGGLCIGNLFAFRSQDKEKMKKAVDPVGPGNDDWLVRLARDAGIVVAAWGNDGSLMNRAEHVLRLLCKVCKVHCLAVTQKGQPQHPRSLPAGLSPKPFGGQ